MAPKRLCEALQASVNVRLPFDLAVLDYHDAGMRRV